MVLASTLLTDRTSPFASNSEKYLTSEAPTPKSSNRQYWMRDQKRTQTPNRSWPRYDRSNGARRRLVPLSQRRPTALYAVFRMIRLEIGSRIRVTACIHHREVWSTEQAYLPPPRGHSDTEESELVTRGSS